MAKKRGMIPPNPDHAPGKRGKLETSKLTEFLLEAIGRQSASSKLQQSNPQMWHWFNSAPDRRKGESRTAYERRLRQAWAAYCRRNGLNRSTGLPTRRSQRLAKGKHANARKLGKGRGESGGKSVTL